IPISSFYLDGEFRYDILGKVCRTTVRNLNHIIDTSFYPIHEELHSQERTESPDKELNQKMRPLAIGISGMFTLLESLGINYRSKESLNRFKTTVSKIMSHMYFNLIFESCRMAIEEFKISGERSHDFNFQFDMRDSYRESILNSEHISDRYKHLI